MATNWLVIEMEDGADEGVVKVISTEELAQEHIAARINAGVAPPRLNLYSGSQTPFGVTYQPIVSIGTDGPKTAKPQAFTPGAEPTVAENGGSPAQEPVAVSAGAANGADASAKQPAGTQDGVRMSSQFPPA